MKVHFVFVAIYGLLGCHYLTEPCGLEKVYKMLTELIDDFAKFENLTTTDIQNNAKNIDVLKYNVTSNADDTTSTFQDLKVSGRTSDSSLKSLGFLFRMICRTLPRTLSFWNTMSQTMPIE